MSGPDFGVMVAQAQHAALMGDGTIGGKLTAAERRAIFERELVRLMLGAKAAELADAEPTPRPRRLDQAARLTPAADQLAAQAVAELREFCETTTPDFDGGPALPAAGSHQAEDAQADSAGQGQQGPGAPARGATRGEPEVDPPRPQAGERRDHP